ncbi:MAG: hypothetical protein ACE5OS_10340 [Anaerolineae bacterium]
MTILIQWLIERVWILYVVCAIGVLIYAVRALAAHRERSLALFTLERETATARAIQAWAMALVFTIIGAAVFAGITFILPGLDTGNLLATPTLMAGLEFPAPVITPAPSPTPGFLVPTFTPVATSAPVPTPAPPEPAETPTPALTDTPEAATSGEVHVRFGDFAELIGYDVPAADITTTQPLLLTLHWQALEGRAPMNYLVFTHLLSADGRLIAQHDGAPASGASPTTGWVPGETIVDPHPMEFKPEFRDYTGTAIIAVGLYDPSDPGARVLTDTGDDRVVLPITINVTS